MPHPLAVHSLIDALAEALRESVFTELSAGASVGESEVARKYEVARPTAKAAIERLVQEGLLRRDAHRSSRVPVLTASDVADLYLSRSCLESESMRRLAATSTPPPDTARQANKQLAAASADDTLSAFVEPDIAFHRALVGALGSTRLRRMHDGLMTETRLCMAQVQAHKLLDPTVIVAEHNEILTAIERGAPQAAAEALGVHLDHAARLLTAHLDTTMGH